MQNKYIRTFIIEPKFRIRLIIFVVLLIAIVIQYKVILGQEIIRLNKMKANEKLIMHINDAKERLQPKTVKPEPGDQFFEDKYLLKGTQIQSGASCALINSTIYKKGDLLGDYIVVKITKGSVVLENKLTKEVIRLYLYPSGLEAALDGLN